MLWHLGSDRCYGNLSPPQKGKVRKMPFIKSSKDLMMLEKCLVFDSCRGLSFDSHESGEFEW